MTALQRTFLFAFIPCTFLFTYFVSIRSSPTVFVGQEQRKHPRSIKSVETEESFRYPGAALPFDGNFSDILEELGFYDKPIDVGDKLPEFTFVTAFSDNHAGEGRHLVVNISRAFPGKKIAVYGMGLSKKNEEWFKKACNVNYRQADLSHYPKHVSSFHTYAFKPIIVANALKEFGGVFWVDTSSHFREDRPVEALLQRINTLNLTTENPRMFLFDQLGHTIYATTHSDMYKYLPPFKNATTLHRKMYAAGLHLVYRTKATIDLVYKWYVLCALDPKCMAPAKAKLSCQKKIWEGKYGGCHRYDQSAINLILGPYEKSHLPENIVDGFIRTYRGETSKESATVVCK